MASLKRRSMRDPVIGGTVAATVHHLAERLTLYMGIADVVAYGEPVPVISRPMLDRVNAEHAQDHHVTGKRETLVLLIENGEKVRQAIASLGDEQPAATATIEFVGETPVTAGQFIQDRVNGYILTQLSRLRGAAEAYG